MNIELLDDHLHQIPEERPPNKAIDKGPRILMIFFEYLTLLLFVGLPSSITNEDPLVLIVCFSIFMMNKDAIGGKSLVKRMANVKLIEIKTGKAPHPVRASLRNLTIFFGFFELLTLFLSKNSQRIGDHLLGTMVVHDNIKEYKSSWSEDFKNANSSELILAIAIYIVPALMFYSINNYLYI